MENKVSSPPILDYDSAGGASYRADFWEGKGREYEDRVERIALKRLLQPASGRRLLELGAGFGRLSDFYAGYEQVILVDYARTQLLEARARLGDQKYLYVAANIYQLPIADEVCDAATMIRVLHHFSDVKAALRQVRAALAPGGLFLLEFANKRNLKALLRYAMGQQRWNPRSLEPIEFVKLHFDFHPDYIQAILREVGFANERNLAVSYLRLSLLKRLLPTTALVKLDALLQPSGLFYSPSIFTQNRVAGQRPPTLPEAVLKCPTCHSTAFDAEDVTLACKGCGKLWSNAEGIYDFRQPLN